MKLYGELARFWDLVSPPSDYSEEARLYERLLLGGRGDRGDAQLSVLELGCGGGHCAVHMGEFAWTLSDLSPAMLARARELCPAAETVTGDMRTLRLGRMFDGVFVHDAVMHMTTTQDLEAACRTAFEHCRIGGVALFAPDWTAETFAPRADHGGADEGVRGVRFLEWVHPLAPGATAVDVDFAFLLRAGDETRIVHDRHRWGVFSSDTWLAILRRVGFVVDAHDVEGDQPRRLFVAQRR